VAKHYKITYKEDAEKVVVTDVIWKIQKEKQRPFVRKSKVVTQ
jgi:hypothetical protein